MSSDLEKSCLALSVKTWIVGKRLLSQGWKSHFSLSEKIVKTERGAFESPMTAVNQLTLNLILGLTLNNSTLDVYSPNYI